MIKNRVLTTVIVVVLILNQASIVSSIPEIYIETTDHLEISLQSFEGEVFLFMAMTSTCSSCKTQNDYLKEIYYHTSNFTILSISIDKEIDTIERLADYKNNEDIPWIVSLDKYQELKLHFQIYNTPELYLIDEHGELIKNWNGLTTSEEINSILSEYVEVSEIEDSSILLNRLLESPVFLAWSFTCIVILPFYLIIRRLVLK